MKKKIIELTRLITVISLLIYMSISSIMITYLKLSLKNYSYYLIIFGITLLIIYIIDKIKNFKFNKYEIFICILIILSSICVFSSINLNTCLFGKVNRFEGLFQILTYYLLMLNCLHISNKKYLKIIIFFIVGNFLINFIYGLYQVHIFGQPKYFIVKGVWKYAKGFVGNSMFYGTLAAISYSLILGMFYKTEKLKTKLILFILLLICSLGIVISGTIGCYLGIIVTIIIIITQCILIKEERKTYNFISILLIIIATGSILLFTTLNNKFLKKDFAELKTEYNAISNGVIKDNFGTGRIYIWKNTINKIIDYKGIGVGIDNFNLAFNNKLIDPKSNLIVDKAHNEYLQRTLCEGILSGLSFVIFIIYIFINNFKKNFNSLQYGLYLAFIAYSVQAFFNISVTRVAPIYYIIIGLLINNSLIKEIENK